MTDSEAAAPEAYVSTAPETSAMGSAGRATSKKKPEKGRPWRENIEAIAISIVTIVLFKYFVLEAYKIPTGSMQPTLMGNEETGIFDRVIVDKLSYHYRDPERFEIVVFKYPLDSSKNFIKRIVGMPGETLYLKGGDAWIQPEGASEAKVLRRSRAIQAAQLRRLETRNEWRLSSEAAADWSIDSQGGGDRIVAEGRGEATFPRTYESIRDDYLDGYPEGIKSKIDDTNKGSNYNDVTDLRLRSSVTADASCREVAFVLREGRREFRFALPGPAAPATDRARVEFFGLDADELPGGIDSSVAEGDVRLAAGKRLDVEVQNLNDRLAMRIGDEEILAVEIPPAPDRARSSVSIAVEAPDGNGAVLDDVKVWRDIFYTTDPTRQKVVRWDIPPDNYVVLGDNPQDSSDGRDWTLASFRVMDGEDEGEIVRGNQREGMTIRPDTNPRYVPNDRRNYERIFFRDERGESHVFESGEVERLADQTASLVPRELIRGRAVLVVWPLAPQHGVYRLKWVR
ncbi:MAG: signal peptidase I [Planctomycetota bacterium]